jgi:tetratricopeptide (TPR) repeat protein
LGTFWLILLIFVGVGVIWLALTVYASYLVRQGRYDQALRLAPLLAPTSVGRSYIRGNMLMEAGRYEEAERRLRESIDHPGRLKVDTTLALEDLGNVLMDMGRFEDAQRCFRDAAHILPNHSLWATGMAEVLLRQGIYPQNALTQSQTALKLFQGGTERIGDIWRLGAILATIAWALAACDRRPEARKAIDAALKSPARKTKGPLAQVHYKAGMSLLQLSEGPGAREHFVRGTGLDPAGRWGRLCAEALRRQPDEGEGCHEIL